MAWRLRHFGNDEQRRAVAALQRQVWLQVVARFGALRDQVGLRQSDLARALGVSRPQIHEWLSDPANITLKAAGRLMLAMDGELTCALVARRDGAGPTRLLLLLAGLAAFFVPGGEPAFAAPAPSLGSSARLDTVARLANPAKLSR